MRPVVERRLTLVAIGGPLDGLSFDRGKMPDPFVWLHGSGRCYRNPGAGMHYYRSSGKAVRTRTQEWRVELHYVGHHSICTGCGVFHAQPENGERLAECTLCGAPLRPARVT